MFDGTTMTEPAYLHGLNAAQRAAVEHAGGPLLVVAGAGTGKTKTLACRVAHLIASGVAPERILLLTFTRRAAREMLGRATRLLAHRDGNGAPVRAGRVWGGTFHATGNRLLRTYGEALGVPPNFTVMDQADGADLMNLIRNELDLGRGRRRFPKKETIAAIYSRCVNARAGLAEVVDKQFPWCRDETDGIRSIFKAYTERKQEQGVLDFDDLLLYWLALMRDERVGPHIAGLFDHVLVDEYQDTNSIQSDILRAMCTADDDIMVVGDDAQAIYSFRAATVTNILDFPAHFPSATVVKLEKNYRSTQPILDVGNAVISRARRRHEKELYADRLGGMRPRLVTCPDEARQSEAVCDAVLEARERGLALKQQAVLFRTGHHSAHLEIELSRRNIPFVKFGGLKFVEAAHVKDVVALLRILENPHDELAWFRVLLLLEGVGPALAGRAMDSLGVRRDSTHEGASPLAALIDGRWEGAVPAPVGAELKGLAAALSECRAEHDATPSSQVESLGAWCEPVFARVYDNSPARVADVAHLSQIAGGYPTRARFLTDLALDPPVSTGDLAGPPLLDEDYLILSTIHSAKGGEWDEIHVIHAADGMMPSDMATRDSDEIEEERRLFYVALTRAKNSLTVYFPLRYYHARMGLEDPHSYGQLTRFVDEGVKSLFDRRSLLPEGDQTLPDKPHPGVQAITDFLSDLWDE